MVSHFYYYENENIIFNYLLIAILIHRFINTCSRFYRTRMHMNKHEQITVPDTRCMNLKRNHL